MSAGRPVRNRAIGEGFGFLLVMPALMAFGSVILFPFLRALWLSLHEYTLATPAPVFIGPGNFLRLVEDPIFWATWGRTLFFVVATTGCTVLLGTAWGIILNEKLRGRRVLRSLSLLPWVIPSVVSAMLWAWLFHGQYGLLNAALLGAGLIARPVFWLSTEWGALAAVIIAKSWLSTPVVMTFVLAGMQSLPFDQIEAARIDGAGNAALLRAIVLPHLRPVVGIIAVLQAMANLQQFDVIYAMTGGGPVQATTTFSIAVYREAFQNWDLGLASAIGVFWFFTIAIPAIGYLRTIVREVA
jgi:multiple sugar transport system permease protein